ARRESRAPCRRGHSRHRDDTRPLQGGDACRHVASESWLFVFAELVARGSRSLPQDGLGMGRCPRTILLPVSRLPFHAKICSVAKEGTQALSLGLVGSIFRGSAF